MAATLNWRNSVWGYWINLATVGIADTGFIFFVLVPGYAPVWPSILGPVFWVLATIFSTIALLTRTGSKVFVSQNWLVRAICRHEVAPASKFGVH